MKSLPARLYIGTLVLFGTGLLAAAFPRTAGSGAWPLLLATVPLCVTWCVYRSYLKRTTEDGRYLKQIGDLHLSTIEALARAIDAKDHASHSHIWRIQHFAAKLAAALGMPEHEVHGLRTAALLHDIGQLAVPDHILSKPGPLTHEEFQKVRTHPQAGAEILAHVPFPYPVAPLILNHHERWDGFGYPAGLAGDQIPLGARVLCVVDYYDALTSERPYHRAMSHEAAVRLLEQESGHALDPAIVARFVELLPRLLEEEQSPPPEATRFAMADLEIWPAGIETKLRTVLDDIAVAHREIHTLYEIAHAMGTSLSMSETMDLIASKLSPLVPFSCCALFLQDEDSRIMRCRFATGVDADLIQGIVLPPGAGATGWVTRTRKTLVNARPIVDLQAADPRTVPTSLKSALVCPLLCHDRLIGTIALYDVQPVRYTDDHGRLVARVAEQAAAVIYNSIVFEQTQADSLTDPLTGLPNMRFLFMHVARELARAGRLQSQMALVVLDLDHFKDINDTYGHHVGDHALREVARILRGAIRPYDTCARYAGDEFIIILSGCDVEKARQKQAELQDAVAEHVFETCPGHCFTLGISGGLAVFPEDGHSYESLLAMADSRMYRDKGERKHAHVNSGVAPTTLVGAPGLEP
jgi:diguanylate cyclase (GGDEF)-like protein